MARSDSRASSLSLLIAAVLSVPVPHQGKAHLAIVFDVNSDQEHQDPFYEVKGIITLEVCMVCYE
jgi:hypothetical protein